MPSNTITIYYRKYKHLIKLKSYRDNFVCSYEFTTKQYMNSDKADLFRFNPIYKR